MKKLHLIPVLFLLFVLNVASMCSNDDDPPVIVSVDPTPVINTVKSGTWRVTFFEDSGTNETQILQVIILHLQMRVF